MARAKPLPDIATGEFRGRVYDSILETIGATPLIRIAKFAKDGGCKADLLAKCEFFNPAHSVKDRIGLAMIEAAERDGKIDKDTVIVEPTSGNTGIALAFVCASKGYRLIIIMPDTASQERPRKAARSKLHEALVGHRIAELKDGMARGGLAEGLVRALLWVGMSRNAVDERGFAAIRRLRDARPEHRQMSLAHFKALVREQFLMLIVDEEAALRHITYVNQEI